MVLIVKREGFKLEIKENCISTATIFPYKMQKAPTKPSFPRGFIHCRAALDDLFCDKCGEIFGAFFLSFISTN